MILTLEFSGSQSPNLIFNATKEAGTLDEVWIHTVLLVVTTHTDNITYGTKLTAQLEKMVKCMISMCHDNQWLLQL